MTGIKNINKETLQYDRITGKLALTLLLLILVTPFLGVSYLLKSELDTERRFIAQQKAGFDYVNVMKTLLEHVQQHRGIAYAYLSGTHEFESRLRSLSTRIDEDVLAVVKVRAIFDSMPQAGEEWGDWRKNWLKLQQQHLQMSPADNFDMHTALIDDILSFIREAVDVFGLVLGTQQDIRALAETVMQMPRLFEDIAQVRGLGSGIIARNYFSNDERLRLRAYRQTIGESMDDLSRNMIMLFERNPLLYTHLSFELNKALNSTSRFLIMVHKLFNKVEVEKISASVYFNVGTTALDDFYHLFNDIENELNNLLTMRLEDMSNKRMLLQVSTLLVLVVTFAIYFIFLRHQAALRESKQKIQAIVENAADSIVTINEQGLILSFNSAAEKMFGYRADEIMEQNVSCLMPEAEKHRYDSYLHRYMESGQGHIIGIGAREVEALHRDGNVLPVDLSISEMQQADGKRLFIGILRDISQRKQAEADLRASEERFDLVTRGTKDGIWDWDLSSGRIYYSPCWKSMLGYAEDEVEDNFMALQSLIHPDDLGVALDGWMACIEGKTESFVIEYRLLNKQGEYLWIQCRGLIQLDEQGNPLRMAGSHTDITERKQAYTELQQMTKVLATKAAELDLSNKELEQFAYIASHDLKAPLRAIANLSQWIEEDLDEAMTDDTRKQMALLRSRVLRMEGLINGILQYSRVGHTDDESESVDVSALLLEIIDGLAVPKGFVIDIAPNMPVFETARVQLSQIFANLLSNAIKYHHQPDQGHVQISMREVDDEYYEFCVADDGTGIAPKYHDKVFGIFQTLNARDDVESTGVGLSIVKKIVETQGGEIKLESAEGEGSSFCFSVPKTKEQAATNEVDSKNPATVVERDQRSDET